MNSRRSLPDVVLGALMLLLIFVACKSLKTTPAPDAASSSAPVVPASQTISEPELKAPEDNRFTKTILTNDLNEPMELAVAPDGRVFITERGGRCYVYSPATNSTKLLREFPVKAVEKYLNGLIGVTLDPDFATNNFIYFFYSSSTGDQFHQNVSRFKLTSSGELDTASEKILIKIPIDLEVSAHTGGSLAWDRDKNLYISTGDNTVPFESDGYAPIDEREGRHTFDAQRSSANTNDLRGKILRIHPEPDGSYTIPEGNLFPKGMEKTRPEIYVMGCRNPYRIAVDTLTSTVYWGEIGPDAGTDSRHGPRGYDEFNQARKPGNYGWPYFVGDTKAYHDSNFATKQTGELFKVEAPENNSPNNTGLQTLPPPVKAMIWYPYSESEQFPLLGEGGRCAMGGPVYHYNKSNASPGALPAYYDKAFFVYDWMRNWVFAVRTDDQLQYKSMEPFMKTNGDFRRPVDIEIAPDGVMYVLEYGSVYGIDNVDARLVKITYNGGNRTPVAKINISDTTGAVPAQITLDAVKSYDYDNDALKYEWLINGQPISSEKNLSYDASEKGVYEIVLKVTDAASSSATDTVHFVAGNTPPVVKILASDNSSFFFPGTTAFKYNVDVKDAEESKIDATKLRVSKRYIPKVARTEMGHQPVTADYNLGKILIDGSDCKACHQLDGKSVGPSFMDVSRKYRGDVNAPGYLANKIITGGGGVWGEHAMSAHPQLTKEEATEMAQYVLAVSLQQNTQTLPAAGETVLSDHDTASHDARYVITAEYTDNGNGVKPITTTSTLLLRSSKLQAELADSLHEMQRANEIVYGLKNNVFLVFKNIDLKNINELTYRIATRNKAIVVETRLDGPDGTLLNTVEFDKPPGEDVYKEVTSPVNHDGLVHDIYVIFRAKEATEQFVGAIDWLMFGGGRKAPVKKNVQKPKPEAPAAREGKKPQAVKPEGERGKEMQDDKARQLIRESDCRTCHTQDKKLIGPSYDEIYTKYRNDKSKIPSLAEKIIKGGAGVWGQIPMSPHANLSKEDAETIVAFILSGKKVSVAPKE